MMTFYPLQYNKFKNYYTNINFTIDENTTTLYLTGSFANKYINKSITIDKNRLNLVNTTINNSVPGKYTYLLVDLYSYTYASNNAPFNSIEPHKPEFLLYFDTNLKIIDNTYSLNTASLNGHISSVNPQANQIPVLDGAANLVLPYTNAIVTKNQTFRRVDLSNATSDYPLAVGEEAIISFTNKYAIQLHIATQDNTVYEMFVTTLDPDRESMTTTYPLWIITNNIYYFDSSQLFPYFELSFDSYTFDIKRGVYNSFRLGYVGSVYCIITNSTIYKNIKGYGSIYGNSDTHLFTLFVSEWKDTTTSWTSIGTLDFKHYATGNVLIRRLI
jgi:hypothetical protein